MIFILGRGGRLNDPCNVFEEMPKKVVARDVVTYNNTMVSGSTQPNSLTLNGGLNKLIIWFVKCAHGEGDGGRLINTA